MSDAQQLLQPQDAPSLVADSIDGTIAAIKSQLGSAALNSNLELIGRFTGPAGLIYTVGLSLKEEVDTNGNLSFGAFTDAGVKVAAGFTVGEVAVDGMIALGAAVSAPLTATIALVSLGVVAAAVVTSGLDKSFNLTNEVNSLISTAGSYIQTALVGVNGGSAQSYSNVGYYISQAGDTFSSVGTDLGVNSSLLQDINSPFSDSSLRAGGMIRVPTSSTPLGDSPAVIAPVAGQTNVFDPSTNSVYAVGSSLDGNDAGALVAITAAGTQTFQQGAYGGLTFNADTTTLNIDLLDGSGDSLGILKTNTTTGSSSLALDPSLNVQAGTTIDLPSDAELNLIAPEEGASAVESLSGYFGDLGVNVVTTGMASPFPRPDGSVEVDYMVDGATPTVVVGQDTATIQVFNPSTLAFDSVTDPAYNRLLISGGTLVNPVDLSSWQFDNVQEVDFGNVKLGESQLDDFRASNTKIVSSGFSVAASGTYTLAGSNINGGTGSNINFFLAATGTLSVNFTGNDADHEQLYAVTTGGNTLRAGNGVGDNLSVGVGTNTLIGGSGGDSFTVYGALFNTPSVNTDTLIGGAGDDTFDVEGALSNGSSISGGGGNNSLSIFGDISQVSINGISTLIQSLVTLTASELNEFSSLSNDTLTAVAANTTYSLAGKMAVATTLSTGSFDNVTLISSDQGGGTTLVAAGNDDKLIGGAGDDFFDVTEAGIGVSVSGGGGNDTLYAGDDISQMAIAADIKTLQISQDGIVRLTADQLANFSTIEGPQTFDPVTFTSGNGTGVLVVTGGTLSTVSLAGKTLAGNIVLDATTTSGNVNLVAGDTGATLKAGSDHDTLTGGSADDTLVAGSGNDTMTGNGGNNAYVFTNALSTSTYTINNFHTDGGLSTVQLAAGVTPEEVTASQSGEDLVLTIANDPIIVQNYFLGDDYKISAVNFADGTSWSTADLEEQVACYLRGTLIATALGDVSVETLAIGDSVLTISGALRPIKWIGRRSYTGRFIVGRKDILPVCFSASSLGLGLPRRDLLVSPHHAMYLDGVLLEAQDLINGVSIVQVAEADQVEYFHVELHSHDVILAEGVPSETFADDDSRGMFHNAHEYARLNPSEIRQPVHYYAPRLNSGFEVETIRRKLAQYAGIAVQPIADVSPLRGFVDAVSERVIEGWAQNAGSPEAPVCLDILVAGQLIGQTLANRYREDLKFAGSEVAAMRSLLRCQIMWLFR